jgi:uncharacterized protein
VGPRTDILDLGRLSLAPGEGRRLDLAVAIEPFEFGGQNYGSAEPLVPVRVDISRMGGNGYALRIRFAVDVVGPCQRCLEPAALAVEVEAREVDQPGGGEELSSPYVIGEELDLQAWARDALALALPVQITCREDCLGLCPECGVNLNAAGPEHGHERAPDPRWSKLDELRLD